MFMKVASSIQNFDRAEIIAAMIRQATPLPSKPRLSLAKDAFSGIGHWWNECRQLLVTLASRNVLISLALLFALVGSGVSVVYAVHLNRQSFIELKRLQVKEDLAQRRWTQLLLEESALTAPDRIERIAIDRLGMTAQLEAKTEMVR